MSKKENKTSKKAHNLSNNSKSAGKDFAYANRLTALIYNTLKDILQEQVDRDCYKRLLTTIRQVLQTDTTSKVGNKKVEKGNLSLLNNFKLNNRRYFDSLMLWKPSITFSNESKKAIVRLPHNNLNILHNKPDRLSRTRLQFFAITMHFPEMTIKAVKTSPLYITQDSTDTALNASFSYDGANNSLLLVVGTCQYYLYEKNSKTDFPSSNRLYYAADIFEAVPIVKNAVIHYKHQEKENKIIKKTDIPEVGWD